jgi:release factor glutamine methyltransferase
MKHDILIFIGQIADNFEHIYGLKQEQEQVAWWLLQGITNKTKATLIAQKELILSDKQENKLEEWITAHRKNLEPLQYILGSVPFCNLDILVESPVLIPRPETEEWCYNLMQKLNKISNKNIKILDLCTGSGCIALALGSILPEAHIIGTDISEQALALAERNALHNNIRNVTFIKSDIYDCIPKTDRFDLIVANPPYIAQKYWETLSPMVRKWEDKAALVAPDEGLAIIEEVIEDAQYFLQSNEEFQARKIPQLVIEIDYNQGEKAKKLMQDVGFKNVTIVKDLEKRDRIVTGGLA